MASHDADLSDAAKPSHISQAPLQEDDNDSGDEWGLEIEDLIIDLDADLEKDEMKSSNLNTTSSSIEGSTTGNTAGGADSSATGISHSPAVADDGNPAKGSKSAAGNKSSQPVSRTKLKSRRSNKSEVTKHGGTAKAIVTRKSDVLHTGEALDSSSSANRSVKPDTFSKSGRKCKKNNNTEKKTGHDGASRDVRERTTKTEKVCIQMDQLNVRRICATSAVYSKAGTASTTPSVTDPEGCKKNRYCSACPPNVDIHCSNATQGSSLLHGKAIVPAMSVSTASQVKQRKTSCLTSSVERQSPLVMPNAPLPLSGSSTTDQSNFGKRERNTSHRSLQPTGNKKIKMEKETKYFTSGMTPNDGEGIAKVNSRSPGNLALNLPGHLPNMKSDYKATVGQQKSSTNDAKGDKRSSTRTTSPPYSQRNGKGTTARATANRSGGRTTPDRKMSVGSPQNNNSSAPGEQKRTIGTDTTFADVGISTEPESLGPCEPGTSVQLSGIVWHETESGVLVVNVTWRNRSYVGTLLDATKHDWAPPRIPDVDSDAEYRMKSGRPKRQRGANGTDNGRKGRKSALANGLDEYKCSASSSKRRSAKMSESDGNDGEICNAPGRPAKRARLSRTATAKLARKAKSATVVKESSGDGTSGSGSSSACSSPVFIECPHANCEKRYKDVNALKYHESHAHGSEGMESVEKTTPADERDSTTIDSPKDSEDTSTSTKSVEEMATSDSAGSPNTGESETTGSDHATSAMETRSAGLPSAQSPFVVTKPPSSPEKGALVLTRSTESKGTPMHPNFTEKTASNEPEMTIREILTDTLSDVQNSFTCISRRQDSSSADGTLSPYTLTDSQSSESISLKSRSQPKPSQSCQTSRTTTLYADLTAPAKGRATQPEQTTAVDNESAQAVKTLLQLQENSQDQLPGLTPYSRTSQVTSTTAPVRAVASSSSSDASHTSPGFSVNELADINPSVSQQPTPSTSSAALAPPLRDHLKDGMPLPRMSVGVTSSTRYATVGNYAHGPATASTTLSQERRPQYSPTRLKTVKGKTVPIPTDPQQTLAASSTQSTATTVPGSSANLKKQKRNKKLKTEAGRLPSDPVPNPSHLTASLPEKDDASKPVNLALDKQGYAVHRRAQHDGHLLPPGGNVQIQPDTGNIKSEPDSKASLRTGPPQSCSLGHEHPNFPQHTQRPHEYSSTEDSHSTNKNNNNKLPVHGRILDPTVFGPGPTRLVHPHHSSGANFMAVQDSQAPRDCRGRAPHPPMHSTSHSLPGSRSQTPVNQSITPHPGPRQNQNPPQAKAATDQKVTPSQQRPHSNKNAASPPSPTDRRKLGGEGVQKRSGFPQQAAPLYGYGMGQYPMVPYETGVYSTQFLNDPKFMRHYDQIIQHEIRKDQKPKEEPLDRSSLSRPTSSPKFQPQNTRLKPPSRTEERRIRESPTKLQQHLPHPGAQSQAGHRIHPQPRASPALNSYPTQGSKNVAAPPASSRGLSPHPRVTPPLVLASRPPRPNSESRRQSRRDSGASEKPQVASRPATVTQSRKNPQREEYAERNSQSPDRTKSRSSPNLPMYAASAVLSGARIPPVQYFAGPYQPPLLDPSRMPSYFTAPPYMFPQGAAHLFHGWQHGHPPPAVANGPERPPSHSPRSGKPAPERPSSGARSPCREEGDSRSRDGVRGRDVDSYASAKERRASDGRPQSRKCVTPDMKTASRHPPNDSDPATVTPPPMQRHLHTHHHIHEGFPLISPQYQYQMAASVMAGSAEAAAALAQFPKRDLP